MGGKLLLAIILSGKVPECGSRRVDSISPYAECREGVS